jgi:hypothetical protein
MGEMPNAMVMSPNKKVLLTFQSKTLPLDQAKAWIKSYLTAAAAKKPGASARHADAVTFFHAAPKRLTHSYVLAEFVPLCQTRRLNRAAALEFAADLMANPPHGRTRHHRGAHH